MQIHFLLENAEDPEQPFGVTYFLFLKNYLVIHSMNIEPWFCASKSARIWEGTKMS